MKPLILMSIHLLVWSCVAVADEPRRASSGQERSVLRAGQIVQGDYFAFGPHVEISGTVNGDVYAAGGEVLMDGTVNGDLIAAGGKVTLSGSVSQDARLAGGQVTIGGTVGRNVTVAGADIRLAESAQVRENLLAAGGSVQLAGPIGRDARVGGGQVTVSSSIERDFIVAAGAVRLTSKAMVGGKLRYWNEAAPSIDEGATVRGGVVQRPLPGPWKAEHLRRGLVGAVVTAVVVNVVSTLMLGLLVVRVYPVFTRTVGDTIGQRPWASLGFGGAMLVVIPLIVMLCLMSVLGIPIGLVLGALYVVTLYIARVFVMAWVGRLVLRRLSDSPSSVRAFLTGWVIYTVLSLLPFVGALVTLATILLGLGSLLMTKGALVASLRERELV